MVLVLWPTRPYLIWPLIVSYPHLSCPHSFPASLASSAFPEYSHHIPTFRPSHWPFCLSTMIFPQIPTWPIPSLPTKFCSNIIFSVRPPWTIPQHSLSLLPVLQFYPQYFSVAYYILTLLFITCLLCLLLAICIQVKVLCLFCSALCSRCPIQSLAYTGAQSYC